MAKERIKKKKRNNDIFESSSGISEAWCLTGMEAPFPKGIQSVDINRLSVDTRDVSWLSLVCDRWEDRFRILLLVSLISTLTPLQVYVRESTYASEQRTEERKETERERERGGSTKSRPRQIGNRSLIRFGTPRIRSTAYTLKRPGKFRCFIDTREIHDPRQEYHRWSKKKIRG